MIAAAGSGEDVDVAVVGAGAAGLATAIFLKRRAPLAAVALLDGAARPGAKILVSGGGRCNVTNSVVRESDFYGAPRAAIRRVLRAFTERQAADFFSEIGVALREEAGGKLFPVTNKARTVLDALIGEAERLGVPVRPSWRVDDVARAEQGFRVTGARGALVARHLVIATGGLSLPKSGSDGRGYAIAHALGHSTVPTTPALVPLLLAGELHAPLSGVALDVELLIRAEGRPLQRIAGALLFTHFGISGPAALDASRHVLRARLESRPLRLSARFTPGSDADAVDRTLQAIGKSRPRQRTAAALATLVPAALAEAVPRLLALPAVALSQLPRGERRRLAAALAEWPLEVTESRGYGFAEVTAGGVPLDEVDLGTMESRVCPGLFLVGEILDVDGRIGGFNFQWAWSSGFAAARALGSALG